ncbi:ABC transporter substrate-binding protein [Beijerinckia indica]|uniref:Putative aliphatic sulfonates-binding protein n=1 Tax=Beijerinckia indica subsp. indica (strain ATCC 9039 / DSM 1715 / NCIMB 8712) TaxID=395963 RepID=B2IEY5_BEII9|nr:ABC transporter substrate-binding protein [Beijerinckia indica]ACB94176.1 ABC transporter, periplasmic substrate-binding protein, aliphatic sulfonates family, putative [Beijerinckia indica subsp. indica ATCC 9039]
MSKILPVISTGLSRRLLLQGAAATTALGASALGPGLALASGEKPLRVARSKGRFDPELLFASSGVTPPSHPIAYSEFGSGKLAAEALNANALDIGAMSEIPPIFIANADPKFRLIAVIKGDVNQQVVLVPRESKIASIADLKGKRVGYVRSTTCHYFLLKMLAEAGLSFNDITLVNLSPADGQAAFTRGALDAWAIYGYSVSLAVHNEGARILKTALGYLSGNYTIAAHVDAIADPVRHAEIAEFLVQWKRSFGWLNTHHEVWAPIEAKALGLPQDFILEELRNQSAPWQIGPVDDAAIRSQQDVADVFYAAGLIPKPVQVAALWDRSFNPVLVETHITEK